MKRFFGASMTTAQVVMIMAVLTLGSKLLGFIREMFQAAYYGTTYVTDTLDIATAIPGMIFAGVLGATATSYIPLFSKKKEEEGEGAANLFTSQTINILLIFSVASSLVGILFSSQLVTLFTMPESWPPGNPGLFGGIGWFLTHGWTGERASLASFYVNITFSYCLFTSVAGISEAWLRFKNVFISPIIAGYAISLMAVIFIIISHRIENPYILVIGTLAGTAIRSVVICIIAGRKGYPYRPDFHMSRTVRQIFALALPVFLGSTASQINIFVNKALASGLQTGSIAALNYASLLIGLLTGVSSFVISTALYPKMAEAYAQKDEPRFTEIFTTGLNTIIIIGAPFTLGALLYSRPLIQIIYERGVFHTGSTVLTSTALFYYGFGLIFAMLQTFLIQAYYSRHDTKTPLITSALMVAINVASNLLLVRSLAHGGLALGWSIATFASSVMLLAVIRKRTPAILNKALVIKGLLISLAAAVSVGASYPFYIFVGDIFATLGWNMPRTLLLFLTVMVAAAIYIILLRLLKTEELIHFRRIFKFPAKPEKEGPPGQE